MIIWSGFGFLVLVTGFGGVILTEIAVGSITGNTNYSNEHGWVFLLGMFVSAALTFGLHKLFRLKKGEIVFDEETGEEIEIHSSHTLFFIPVQWWPVIFVAIGIYSLFSPLSSRLDTAIPIPEMTINIPSATFTLVIGMSTIRPAAKPKPISITEIPSSNAL